MRERERDHLGARMEHAADIGADGVVDVVEGAVVPLRVAGISPESLRFGLGLKREQAQSDNKSVCYWK